jgi:signal transduction histidine kinase
MRKIYRCVQNFGVGITPDMQKRIFDRFFRLNEKRSPLRGWDCAYYIAAELVKRHGRTIIVESTPGEDSVFVLQFPRTIHLSLNK